MPLLNSKGDILAGVAGQQASVNDVLMPVSGYAAWVDDDHIVGQSLDFTKVILVPVANPSAFTVVATHGANRCFGGNGQWASFLATAPSQVDSSLGKFVGASVYDMGSDGTLALKPDYQASAGLQLVSTSGTVTDLQANPTDLQVLSATEAVWSAGPGVYKALGRTAPTPAVLTQHFRVVTTPDNVEWVIIQGQNGGAFAHPNGNTKGYVLAPVGQFAGNVEARLVNGEIVVVWSTTPSEAPHQQVKITLDRTAPRVDLVPTEQITPPQAIQAHPRKLWLSPYFSFSERYGCSDKAEYLTYGNAATILEEPGLPSGFADTIAKVYPLGLPLIIDTNTASDLTPYMGSVVAWFAYGTDFAGLQHAVEGALNRPECPVIAYLDAPEQWPSETPTWLTDRVWPSVQAYRAAGETISNFTDRMVTLLTKVSKYGTYLVLTPRWDDVNGTQPVSFTTDCMPVYAKLIQDFPICGIMPFSDRRGRGINADPILKQWAQLFSLANVTRPNRFDYWTSKDPVTSLTNKLGQTTELAVLTVKEKQFLLTHLPNL